GDRRRGTGRPDHRQGICRNLDPRASARERPRARNARTHLACRGRKRRRTEAQKQKRAVFHGASSSSWTQATQPYGVRCRALGGSTHAWAGKSAAFDAIDFQDRPWVPYSGWPIARQSLSPYLDRAAYVLNLGPNVYDDELWELIGASSPKPNVDADIVRSFFWQFARSRVDHLDVMRFGREFASFKAP